MDLKLEPLDGLDYACVTSFPSWLLDVVQLGEEEVLLRLKPDGKCEVSVRRRHLARRPAQIQSLVAVEVLLASVQLLPPEAAIEAPLRMRNLPPPRKPLR